MNHDDRLKRLRFRAWHRGTREADYMIGDFFDRHYVDQALSDDPIMTRLSGYSRCDLFELSNHASKTACLISAPPVVATPDATVDLQWVGGALRIAGPDKAPPNGTLPAGTIVVGPRFRPAWAASWLWRPLISASQLTCGRSASVKDPD